MSNLLTNEQLKSIARDYNNDEHFHVVTSFRQNISTTVMDDIHLIPSTSTIPYPNGIQLKVASDNTNDTALGTGVRQVDIHYLDSNYLEEREFVTLNGTTPVNIIATDVTRILDFHTQLVGSNGVSVGNISLTNLAGTITYDYLQAGGNQSLTAHYTVPDNKIGYITGWQATSTKQAVSVRLRATRSKHELELLPLIFTFQDVVNLNNTTSGFISFSSPLKCLPRTDIKLSAIGTGAAGADCSASFGILVVNKP